MVVAEFVVVVVVVAEEVVVVVIVVVVVVAAEITTTTLNYAAKSETLTTKLFSSLKLTFPSKKLAHLFFSLISLSGSHSLSL